MASCINISVYLGHPLKTDTVIGFIIKKAAVLLKPSVGAQGYELMTFLKVGNVPGVGIGILH